MIGIFTIVVYHGGKPPVPLCVCECVCKRAWWIFLFHHFNPIPAVIRLFDKLGNYNKKIALRPWSSQWTVCSCDWAARHASHHLSFMRPSSSFMVCSPEQYTCSLYNISFCDDDSLPIFLLSARLSPYLYTSDPCMGPIKAVFLPFSSWTVVAALCMWGASERTSLCTS